MKKYNILDFTNREVEVLAQEYIDSKLKRQYKIVDKKGTRNRALGNIELVYVVKDSSQREYNFRFYFSEYLMECFAQWDTAVYPLKETSDENIELMEGLISLYVEKFGLEYVDDFINTQGEKEEERYSKQKEKANRKEEYEFMVKDHLNNQKQLAGLKDRMLAKFSSKKV